jgi:hypothetical protein
VKSFEFGKPSTSPIDSMQRWRIILTLVIFLAARQNVWSQQFAPGVVPSGPPATAPVYPVTTVPAPGAIAPPPYLQPSPAMIQPAPAIAPVVPAPGTMGTVVPLNGQPLRMPSQTPGSIFGPPLVAPTPGAPTGVPVSPLADIAPGGLVSPQFGLPPGPESLPGPQNVIAVPVVDDDLAWDQIADVVSDYFPIAREQRARRGEVACEGRIETAPQDGATWLEPHRGDSLGEFNRW